MLTHHESFPLSSYFLMLVPTLSILQAKIRFGNRQLQSIKSRSRVHLVACSANIRELKNLFSDLGYTRPASIKRMLGQAEAIRNDWFAISFRHIPELKKYAYIYFTRT